MRQLSQAFNTPSASLPYLTSSPISLSQEADSSAPGVEALVVVAHCDSKLSHGRHHYEVSHTAASRVFHHHASLSNHTEEGDAVRNALRNRSDAQNGLDGVGQPGQRVVKATLSDSMDSLGIDDDHLALCSDDSADPCAVDVRMF